MSNPTIPKPPVWLKPTLSAIPKLLQRRLQWVLWQAIWVEGKNGKLGKWTKPPFSTAGFKCSHSNPAHWDSFENACTAYTRGGWDGIGYVLAPDDELVGIDLDHCRNPKTGKIAAWALKVIKRFASYTEVSPSGTGIRIFVIGKLPGTGHKGKGLGPHGDGAIEIYDKSRYLTLTGRRLSRSPVDIKPRQRVVNAILAEYFPTTKAVAAKVATLRPPLNLADRSVLDCALASVNGKAFHALYYEGDLSAHNDDHSAADYSLVRSLLFFTGGDEEQAIRLFTESALYRDKWDREDYQRRTIDRALSTMTCFYEPDHLLKSLARHQHEHQ